MVSAETIRRNTVGKTLPVQISRRLGLLPFLDKDKANSPMLKANPCHSIISLHMISLDCLNITKKVFFQNSQWANFSASV